MQIEQPLAGYNGSPQKENGFTPIANELLEAIISSGFSSRQLSVLFAIIRCTYGYNKKSDAVSGWQLAKMTNIDRSHISKTINELTSKNILTKHETGRLSHGIFVNELSINKYYDTWLTVDKTATVAEIAPLPFHGATVAEIATVTVAELATQPLPKQPTHKDITKDIKDSTKDNTLFSEIDPDVMSEWNSVRRKKRAAPLSKIVYNAMLRESTNAGISLEAAIIVCVERSWIAFNAEWYRGKGTGNIYEDKQNQLKEFNKNNNIRLKMKLFGTTEKEVCDAS
jgi:phage replication O-like protein O